VSLLASGTEIVCALGAGDALVGRSHECDNPEWVRRLPVCTQPTFDVHMSSAAIDAEVRRRVRSGAPLYYVDADLVRRLQPDTLITQIHCDVCAVTPEDVARAGCAPRAADIVSLSAGTVAGIYEDIRKVGRAIARAAEAETLIAGMRRRIDAVTAAIAGRPRPTVIVIEWTDPLFTAANWLPELIDAAGGMPLAMRHGEHSATTAWTQIVDADPDYVIVAPCGFDLDRTARERDVLERLPGWFDLAAVRHRRVAIADGNRYFNRSGTTIVETVEILGEMLHAERVAPRHGQAWRQYRPSPSSSLR
jgi:iron complex transport system substrate-binding protein